MGMVQNSKKKKKISIEIIKYFKQYCARDMQHACEKSEIRVKLNYKKFKKAEYLRYIGRNMKRTLKFILKKQGATWVL